MKRVHSSFDRMDLNLLRVFETVFQERHLTRAARLLALSPSAVSHALRRLRGHLGDPLFERQGSSMVPTATCERMAPALLAHLSELRGLLSRWGAFEPTESTQAFRIGMPEAVEPMLLPPLRRALASAAPRASLASVSFQRPELALALATRQLDLVVDVALPMTEPVRHEPLLADELCIVVRERHPLTRTPTLAQYLAARHIVVSARARGAVLEDVALLAQGLERRVSVRCQSYAAAFRLVAQSDDLLTVPGRVALEVGGSLALARRRLPVELPPVQLHLYWHGNSEADPASRWLRGQVHDAIALPRASARRAVKARR